LQKKFFNFGLEFLQIFNLLSNDPFCYQLWGFLIKVIIIQTKFILIRFIDFANFQILLHLPSEFRQTSEFGILEVFIIFCLNLEFLHRPDSEKLTFDLNFFWTLIVLLWNIYFLNVLICWFKVYLVHQVIIILFSIIIYFDYFIFEYKCSPFLLKKISILF
jgi:hypothetical protein